MASFSTAPLPSRLPHPVASTHISFSDATMKTLPPESWHTEQYILRANTKPTLTWTEQQNEWLCELNWLLRDSISKSLDKRCETDYLYFIYYCGMPSRCGSVNCVNLAGLLFAVCVFRMRICRRKVFFSRNITHTFGFFYWNALSVAKVGKLVFGGEETTTETKNWSVKPET